MCVTVANLVLNIYDCALQPARWPAVLQDISGKVGAFGAMIFDCGWQGATERVALRHCSSVYDPELVGWYVDTFNAYEVADQGQFARLSSQGDEVNLIRCDDLYASRTELESRPNMAAMMNFGVHYRAGALLSKDTTAMDRFALQFRKEQGPISETARLEMQFLLPHVAKALAMGRALEASEWQRMAMSRALDALPFGIGIVRGGGDIIYRNSEFDVLCDDFRLTRKTSAAKLLVSALPLAMQGLLRTAMDHGKFGARPLREAALIPGAVPGTGLFIEISPIRDHPEFERFGENCFLISLLDTQRAHNVNAETVRRYFPMTESEMAVLDLLVKGHTNAEIADLRGRSLETVNSQMKALIRKSGTRNRTELVRVAVSLSVSAMKPTQSG